METIHDYAGPLAGLATSVLWTATALFFTAAAKRLGTTVLNATRISMAVVLLAITHYLINGYWLPAVCPRQVFLLALSGVVGLTIGDQALFRAFVVIGPRTAMLIMTTAPLWAALFGWLTLGETLGLTAWAGVLLTVGGVAWVVLERPKAEGPSTSAPRHRVHGYLFALIGAICQAGGLLLSKQGMGHGWLPDDQHVRPQTATLVRMFFAGVGMIPIMVFHWRASLPAMARTTRRDDVSMIESTAARSSRSAGLLFASCGAVFGPFLGVWMSLVASDLVPLGIAQTLCSLSPILILLYAATIHRERISPRAVVGTALALAGAGALFIQ